MTQVAVLGCGPAGLLCAWAVEQAGHTPIIFSRKEKSDIPGSQHLHGPIPGITSQYPEGTIQFVRIGTASDYALKVYGDRTRETGWDNYLQVYPSWNVINAYEKLWAHYEDEIADTEIMHPSSLKPIVEMFDCTISTLPAKVICENPMHHFRGVPYYIKKLPTPEADREHEIVVYNGLPDDSWYRWSILGGLCSIESTEPFDDPTDVIIGHKAVDNNCDCWPEIHRAGRWAEWRHGVTMYKAYLKADEIARTI